MAPIDLARQHEMLKLEADDLLRRFSILSILSQFGEVHIDGSYKLGLMTWRDLDIYLEMRPVDSGHFLEMGRQLGQALKPRKLSFTDHLNFPTTEVLTGLYWGIQTDLLSRGGWKLDVWGVTDQVCLERIRHSDSLLERITPRARQTILTIKNEVCRHPGYRDTVTSQDIYDAVLIGASASVQDFWAFIAARDAQR